VGEGGMMVLVDNMSANNDARAVKSTLKDFGIFNPGNEMSKNPIRDERCLEAQRGVGKNIQHDFGVKLFTCVKLGLYASYTQWGAHHMRLDFLFHWAHSPKPCMFALVNTIIIKRMHKFQ
jgi:hypothetical protein